MPSSLHPRTHRGGRLAPAVSKPRSPAPSGHGSHTSFQPGRKSKERGNDRRGKRNPPATILMKSKPTWSLLKAVWSVSKPSCSQASSSSLGETRFSQGVAKAKPTCKCSPAPCSCIQRREPWVRLFCPAPSAMHAPKDSTLSFAKEANSNLDEASEGSQASARTNHYHRGLGRLKLEHEIFSHLGSVG